MVNGAIYSLPYDLVRDFEPIGLLSKNPLMIIGRKTLPADDLKGLIAWLKANPEKATQGNPTAGGHVAGAYFQKETGTHFTFVPYRGAGPAMQDLVSGQIDLLIVQPAVALPQVQSGAIKAFAATGKARLAVAPNIETVAEGGLPNLEIMGWYGLFAPKGTPKEIIAKLSGAVTEALADPACASASPISARKSRTVPSRPRRRSAPCRRPRSRSGFPSSRRRTSGASERPAGGR